MILVYTGEGKGKTTAATGQAIRALGQNMTVAFAQFLKRPGQAGEQDMLSRLLGSNFHAGGLGFLRREEERPAHRNAALSTLAWAAKQLAGPKRPQLLVLDESIYALSMGLLHISELTPLLDQADQEPTCHVVLTGRDAPEQLIRRADLVTTMTVTKHPFDTGTPAQPGIEY